MHTCCMHWQLMRMRVHREKKKKILGKKNVISQIRTCDLLTWSQQLFCIDTRTFSPAIRARSPTDTNIQASKQTKISAPNSLVWGSLRLAAIRCYPSSRITNQEALKA